MEKKNPDSKTLSYNNTEPIYRQEAEELRSSILRGRSNPTLMSYLLRVGNNKATFVSSLQRKWFGTKDVLI